ncbi:MAG: hypothetical protein A2Y15_01170 [Clostridiales bacterium GWF2_36_10]|nr:MAG: hypothetical protein A2Y15_01170 [Clostridiales bacterium GWF2_36_10]HAN22012.1 hypothetical protein [Clostridiales bacterium]
MEEQRFKLASDNGEVTWDISALIKDIFYKKLFETDKVIFSVPHLCNHTWFGINEVHAETTDTNNPIIVIEINDKYILIADGNHRIFKASKMGLKNIEGFLIPRADQQKYIIDFDLHTYDTVMSELICEGIFIDK